DREESGLAFVVPPGKRAVAVSVNEVVGSGGMIVPGDDVDVVAVIDTRNSQNGPRPSSDANAGKPQVMAVAQYILQNVEVMAVAQKIEGEAPPPSTAQKLAGAPSSPQPALRSASVQPAARTVTLAVTPSEAERLVLAEDKGHIRLVLRAHGDDNTFKTGDGLFTELNGIVSLKSEPGS
ncbi:MAG: Flp pilus assembly protein CpaB, partial [Chloroflexota bacterium]|nr:Flp pilus assembly protein CpaB [Chloroflexota bacterium]